MQRPSSKSPTNKPSFLKALLFWSIAFLFLAGAWSGVRFDSAPQVEPWIDDRLDVYELSGETLEDADSVVALIHGQSVSPNGNGTATLLTTTFGTAYNLCPSERFQAQPTVSFCSGVLVAPDVIVTAAYCLAGKNLSDIQIVFGYRMTDPHTAQTVFPLSELYQAVEVTAWQLEEAGSDWALIRLDRTVVNHRVAHIRTDGKITDGQAVHAIGHPQGLPAKFAAGALEENHHPGFFNASIISHAGNSGSPVFNSTPRMRSREFLSGGDRCNS
jgi:S1-C subfamily serine protease